MRHTWNHLVRAIVPALVVIASTITVQPILGAEPNEELKAIRDLLSKIDQRLENQNTISLQMLDKFERLKTDFGQLKTEMNGLRDELTKVQRDMSDLRQRSGASGASTSYFGGSVPTAPASSASIRLVNTYLTDMTANINGFLYVVPPGQTRTVPVVAGPVSYQVYQTQNFAKATSLRPGEILTLSLYPMQ